MPVSAAQEEIAWTRKHICGFSAPDLAADCETVWDNPGAMYFAEVRERLPLSEADIADGARRLERFVPFIARRFPETVPQGGIIEFPLTGITDMREYLNESCSAGITGQLFLKRDSVLAVAGSVKACGGIYEVLYHTEELAMKHDRDCYLGTIMDKRTS